MTELLAPNGKPSNLTPEQYSVVRTPEFKKWFGDWEKLALTKINDSGIDEISLKRLEDGVSKIVDYNGEPLPVYHGTSEEFSVFYNGSYFTDDFWNADGYASGEIVLEVFLNIKNPLVINSKGRKWNNLKSKYGTSTQEITGKLDEKKYDGVIFNNINDNWFDDEGEPQNVYYAIKPEQIKLADGTNTTFQAGNPDIRYEDGGVIINPTEIECHKCHWHWKVKDGGDDLFVCHKCNYDNSKFYKFQGLEGEKILDTISFKKGGRTISQTPAPKKDRIYGSDKNKEGTSKDLKSAKKIELSDKTIESIKNKVDKHNEKHPKKKITIESAKAVLRRGMGAYSSSHRPTISGGNPNSRVAWGLARLNAFLYKIVNGKSKSGKYSQDNDLIEELGYKVQKYSDGGGIQAYKEAMDISEFKEGGEAKPKKVYVSIQLPYDIEKIKGDAFAFYNSNFFYRHNEKPFEELKNGKLEGLVGVSTSPSNIAEWFINRDCLIVMDYEQFIQINETETINYYDPYQLMANKLYLFKRLYANVSRYGEQENVYQQTLTKIGEKIRTEIILEMNVSTGQRYSELYRIDRFLDPYITSAFYSWVDKKQNVESPIDFTNAILEFNQLDDSYLGSGFEYPVLTFDELLPIVEKGITNASKIYESEQEIVLTNRELNIPKKSQLFFIGKNELGQDTKSDKFELIEKYQLKDLYKIYLVNRQELEKYRSIWLKKEQRKFDDNLEKGRQDLELKKEKVLEELLDYFLEKSLNSIKNEIEKDILDFSESLDFYDEKNDEYIEQNWYSIPIVQNIIDTYTFIVKNFWKSFIEKKQVKNLDLYAFSNFQNNVHSEIKRYFEDKKEELEELYNYRNTKGNYSLQPYLFERLFLKSVYDYENLPEWIDYKELSKMYLDKMGREIYRYYNQNDLKLISNYKEGGEADEPTHFWGSEAGGVLVYCSTTDRYLILLRSEWVLEPNTWGIISGKLDDEENVQEAVLREAEEETGHKLGHLIPSFLFEKPNFKFHNFVSIVKEEFTPELNWENSDYKWVKINEMPDNLHFGLKLLLEKEDIPTLVEKNKNNTMNKNNPKDTITMDIPLLIRFAELMREDIKTDVALHEVIENLLDIKDKGVLTMSDYDSIVGNVTGAEEKMENGAVVIDNSIADNSISNPVVGMALILKEADNFDSVYYVYQVGDDAVRIGVNEGNTTGISISDLKRKFRPATQQEVDMTKTMNQSVFDVLMAEGGKVESIKSKKGDIKVSLDDNWYSDDTKVELVPVSELVKFREFDRKVKPKYNQDNSRDNINHLKFMFQRDGVKEPLIIEYSPQDNAVLVIEGNHRLNSAIDLGMEYLPARVVLRKYSKFAPNQLKSTMSVSGVTADERGYISSDLKPSQVGIEGSMPIAYAEGGIIEGRLHSECGDDGCGRKFQVGENGHIIEAERDEAVIVAEAFDDNEEYTIKGTPSEVASALNVMGGGKNFDKGATIVKNGDELEIPELKKEAIDTDVDDIIDSGSIIINRRSMADEKEYEVTGTPKQIASAINSLNGNGVIIEKGAEIKEN